MRHVNYGSGPKSGPGIEWKPHIQHDRKLHDLRAGYEIVEGYRIRHTKLAKTLIDVRQGGVFYRAPDRFQATIFF